VLTRPASASSGSHIGARGPCWWWSIPARTETARQFEHLPVRPDLGCLLLLSSVDVVFGRVSRSCLHVRSPRAARSRPALCARTAEATSRALGAVRARPRAGPRLRDSRRPAPTGARAHAWGVRHARVFPARCPSRRYRNLDARADPCSAHADRPDDGRPYRPRHYLQASRTLRLPLRDRTSGVAHPAPDRDPVPAMAAEPHSGPCSSRPVIRAVGARRRGPLGGSLVNLALLVSLDLSPPEQTRPPGPTTCCPPPLSTSATTSRWRCALLPTPSRRVTEAL